MRCLPIFTELVTQIYYGLTLTPGPSPRFVSHHPQVSARCPQTRLFS